ncbi:MAG TPA: DUF3310 domain-containing protein [Aquella sp.]|jgi:hypothetical protein|nr:DUF3310 domain-containing protein [Aquella sp.]
MTKPDPINPEYYKNSNARCTCGRSIECIDVARNWGFSLGNVLKYLWRHKQKDGLEALKKAQWYLYDYVQAWEKSNDRT